MKNKRIDAFISHASEDKLDFVKSLANLLRKYGSEIWYDEFSLRIGRSISRSIDKGISNCNFGIIVISPYFIKKNWTEYELKSLNSFEIENGDVLLPIWKDISIEEIKSFSPYLADKYGYSTSDLSIEEIAYKLIEKIRPDIYDKISKDKTLEELSKKGNPEVAKTSKMIAGPFQHYILSDELISRIRLIRAALLLGNDHSMKYWVDGFRRDVSIERNIGFWEHVSTCYLETLFVIGGIGQMKDMEQGVFFKKMYELVYQAVEYSSAIHSFKNYGYDKSQIELVLGSLGDFEKYEFEKEFVGFVKKLSGNFMPIYDKDESFPIVS